MDIDFFSLVIGEGRDKGEINPSVNKHYIYIYISYHTHVGSFVLFLFTEKENFRADPFFSFHVF